VGNAEDKEMLLEELERLHNLEKAKEARAVIWALNGRTFTYGCSADGDTLKYGKKPLRPEVKEKVSADNFLPEKPSEVCQACIDQGKPAILFDLLKRNATDPSASGKLASTKTQPDVKGTSICLYDVHQMPFGSMAMLLHRIRPPIFDSLTAVGTGEAVNKTAHRAVLAVNLYRGPEQVSQWNGDQPQGGGDEDSTLLWSREQALSGKTGILRKHPGISDQQGDVKASKEDRAVGELRRAHTAVHKVTTLGQASRVCGSELDRHLKKYPEDVQLSSRLVQRAIKVQHDRTKHGKCAQGGDACLREEATERFRKALAEIMGATDVEPGARSNHVAINLRPGVFGAWQKFSGDPDTEVAKWIAEGGPCGITMFPKDVRVFPKAPATEELVIDPGDLLDGREWACESHFENDEKEFEVMEAFVKKGYVHKSDSTEEAKSVLGGNFVARKPMALEKVKPWARIAAFAARLVQSFSGHLQLRVNTYVDDPCLALRGTKAERDSNFAKTLPTWLNLGFNLAWQKAQRSLSIVWTLASIVTKDDRIIAAIKDEIISAVYEDCCRRLAVNVVPIKALRTFAGRMILVASPLFAWNPFISSLWAPITGNNRSDAPAGSVWTKQVVSSLVWIKEVIDGTKGSTKRVFYVDAYFGRVTSVTITFDACPWGIGGILSEGGIATEYCASPINDTEAKLLTIDIGSSSAQQVAEALAVLVGLRPRAHKWRTRRMQMHCHAFLSRARTTWCRRAWPLSTRIDPPVRDSEYFRTHRAALQLASEGRCVSVG